MIAIRGSRCEMRSDDVGMLIGLGRMSPRSQRFYSKTKRKRRKRHKMLELCSEALGQYLTFDFESLLRAREITYLFMTGWGPRV